MAFKGFDIFKVLVYTCMALIAGVLILQIASGFGQAAAMNVGDNNTTASPSPSYIVMYDDFNGTSASAAWAESNVSAVNSTNQSNATNTTAASPGLLDPIRQFVPVQLGLPLIIVLLMIIQAVVNSANNKKKQSSGAGPSYPSYSGSSMAQPKVKVKRGEFVLHVNGVRIGMTSNKRVVEANIPGLKGGNSTVVATVVKGPDEKSSYLKNLSTTEWTVFRKIKCGKCGTVNDPGADSCTGCCAPLDSKESIGHVPTGKAILIADGVMVKFGIYTGEFRPG